MASGISNTFRIGGVAAGVAALGAILESRIGVRLRGGPTRTARLAGAIAAGGIRAAGPLADAADNAFVFGLNDVFIAAAATVLIGAVAVLGLVRLRQIGHRAPASENA